ncbi:FtsX-like permease family protein [Streptomyces sp. ALI-76-A]|uniref:FtsX-like permease family protein n=1 Tax=Streptomyces sp. ALI-76-A TaxID=3025736 RepID=UPI00256EF9EF|nr:FtsX-like permease family protein [Streptomyces sp. ALI-76-A]MDL5199069.1 FtsX-like permease family protein [Streptomyces sp. ALI-76-A]
MLRIALATLRVRSGAFAATFVALLLGAAVISACGVLLESGLRSALPPERYEKAPVVVAGRQSVDLDVRSADGTAYRSSRPLPERPRLDASLALDLAAVDGVASVVPDRGATVRLLDGDRVVTGANGAVPQAHTWRSRVLGGFRLAEGHGPQGSRQVVLDTDLAARAGLRTGDDVRLMAASTPLTFEVAGLVSLDDGRTPRQSVLFASAAAMKRLVPRFDASVDAFGVFTAPGVPSAEVTAGVERVLAGHHAAVYTGDGRGEAEFTDIAVGAANLVELVTAVGGNVLLVAVFVLCATTSLAVRHRRREMALLRAVGATPGQLRRMITAESATAGLVAGVLGCPLGVGVVYWLSGQFAGRGLVPPDFWPVIGPLPFLAAVGATVLTAVTAAFVAARAAARVRPTEALREASAEPARLGRGRLVTGGLLLALAVSVLGLGFGYRTDFMTLVGLANSLVLLLVIAAAVLGPLITRAATALLAPLLVRTGVTGWLAAAHSHARAARTAAAVTPLLLAVSFAATVVFTQTTQLSQAADEIRSGTVADQVLTAPAGVSPDLAERAAELPGVRAATGVVRSKAVGVGSLLGTEEAVSLTAQGLEPSALSATVDLDAGEGDLSALAPDTVALSTTAASWLGLGVGDRARLYFGDGVPFTGEVIAVYGRGLGFADLTFDHDLLLSHTTAGVDQSVLIRSAAGTAPGLSALARDYPGTALSGAVAVDAQVAEQRATAWVNYVVVGVVIAYTALTVVNTQAMNTATRRREFALLRLTGSSRSQVLGMVRWESFTVAAVGGVLGTLLSVPPLALVALALTGEVIPTVPVLGWLTIVGSTALLAVAGAMLPTRLMLRGRPVDAIGTKE